MKIARVVDEGGRTRFVSVVPGEGFFELAGDLYSGDLKESSHRVEVDQWLAPVEPRAIICVASNYRQHIEEFGEEEPELPVLFMKNPAAATGHKQAINIPEVCGDEVDYEAELAVVISKDCRDVRPEEVVDYVLGYTAGNDVSARIWQKEKGGGQWCRGKGFDSFAPMGPWLVTKDELADTGNLRIGTILNGERVQGSNTSMMIRSVGELISFISQDTTLLAGTVVFTGTPHGVGWAREPRLFLKKGDVVEVEIEGIGILENTIE